jgi:peptidoglycan/LPS O-acetylase OafA/YrhL
MLIVITAFNLKIGNIFWRNLDRILGKFAYSMFFSHFAAFFITRMLMEHFTIPFTKLFYVTVSVILTFFLSGMSYYLIEANIDRIRAKLKKRIPSSI